MKHPDKLNLAMLPTPIYRLDRTSKLLGASLWVKRDDLTGAAESGNKIRKLEFFAADAMSKGANVLITCGGEQSNHCRATALVARRLGMDIHLILRRTAEGPSGNFLLDIILGSTIRWVTPDEYRHRDDIMSEEAQNLRKAGKTPYIIPEGGSNALGMWGYILAAQELYEQTKKEKINLDYVVVPSGSGATYAGLWLGFKSLKIPAKVIGVSVSSDTEDLKKTVERIVSDFFDIYKPDFSINKSEIDIIGGFSRRGYGIIDDEFAEFISNFASREGLILDPAYTGKTFMAVGKLLQEGKLPNNKNIILIHTGGIFGVFTKGEYFRELYFSKK